MHSAVYARRVRTGRRSMPTFASYRMRRRNYVRFSSRFIAGLFNRDQHLGANQLCGSHGPVGSILDTDRDVGPGAVKGMGVESVREAGILPTELLPLSQRTSTNSRLRASPKSPSLGI